MDKFPLLGLLTLLCNFIALFGSFPENGYQGACPMVKCFQVQAAKEVIVDRHQSSTGEIVQCRMCHLQFPGEKCSRGRGICSATLNEACATGRIFKHDGTHWLTFMGCVKNCADVNSIRWSVYLVNYRCCRSHDLCNEML